MERNSSPTRSKFTKDTPAILKSSTYIISVSGLRKGASTSDIFDQFETCGTVISVELFFSRGSVPAETAQVTFSDRHGLDAALAQNGKPWPGTGEVLMILDSSAVTDIASTKQVENGLDDRDTVYVGNLPPDLDRKALYNLFKKVGEVSSVEFAAPWKSGMRNFCFVSFVDSEVAQRAVKLGGTVIHNHVLKVEMKIAFGNAPKKLAGGAHAVNPSSEVGYQAKSRNIAAERTDRAATTACSVAIDSVPDEAHKVLVKGLPRKAREFEIIHFFSICGAVRQVTLQPNNAGRPSGLAYVTFSNRESVVAAVALNSKRWLGTGPLLTISEMNDTVYIGNLPPTTNEESLSNHFRAAGEVIRVRLIHANGIFRGFGFVSFAEGAAVLEAVKLNGTCIGGQAVYVAFAIPHSGYIQDSDLYCTKCFKKGHSSFECSKKIKSAHQKYLEEVIAVERATLQGNEKAFTMTLRSAGKGEPFKLS
jgi:RNA recognition motif-containing protein